MKTVKLYKGTVTKAYMASMELGSGFDLVPWGGNTREYEGYDDGGRDYILPDGYDVAKTIHGKTAIFHGDTYCEIETHSCGRPQLVSGSSKMPVLELA